MFSDFWAENGWGWGERGRGRTCEALWLEFHREVVAWANGGGREKEGQGSF